jgi:hypothetical protein
MNKTWKVVVGVILIFLFGWLCGAICTSISIKHRVIQAIKGGPEGLANAVQRPLERGLNLSDEQQLKFHQALVAYFRQRSALQKQIQPQVEALNQQSIQEVDAFLKSEQQVRLSLNLEKLRADTGRKVLDGGKTPLPAPNSAGTNSAPAGQ